MFMQWPGRLAQIFIVTVCAAAYLSSIASVQADSSESAYDPLVRVHLARAFDGSKSLSIISTAPYEATVLQTGKLSPRVVRTISAGVSMTVEALARGTADQNPADAMADGLCSLHDGESLTLSPIPAINDLAISTIRRDASRQFRYRGALLITAHSNGTLSVINTLPLDDYLKGVVGPEIGPSAPLEAIKAQAIAARTYAVKNFGKCVQDGGSADLDDTTRCQNYLGYNAETWRCRMAVDQTAGKIITYDGIPIDAVYSTDSGGITAQGAEPYLKPVLDPSCEKDSPWMVSLPLSDLSDSLAKIDMLNIRSLRDVEVATRDTSGRADEIALIDSSGKRYAITGIQLRKVIGFDRLRSTLFDVKIDRLNNCVFTGRGWGHGLGMSQNGAIAMARDGAATCDQIVYHYYSGVEISDLTSDFLQADSDTSRDAAYVAQ